METDDLVFKLRLGFDIYCMALEEGRVPQIEEDTSLLHKSMCQLYPHKIEALSDLQYELRSVGNQRSRRNI